MIALLLAGSLVVGGALGALMRRRSGRVGGAAKRSLDDPSVGAQAGFTNQGPQS